MKQIILLVILCACALPTALFGRETPLRVQTIERHPFVIADEQGLTGFSIELWEAIADSNGWEYEYQVTDTFTQLLAAPQTGAADLSIANISITADREEIMDFSIPIYDGGMLMMVSTEYDTHAFLQALTRGLFIIPLILFFVITLICAGLVSRLGKKRSLQESLQILIGFGKDYKRGVERIIALVWYTISIALIIVVTVELTSVTILTEQNESITTVDDLAFKRIGVIQGSTAEAYLRSKNVEAESYQRLEPLLSAIDQGFLDVVVHDAPVISYYVNNVNSDTVRIAGDIFNEEQYGIALPTGSVYTEQINQTLRRFRETGVYDKMYNTWFK